jgi:hypothetical protein
MPSYAEPHSPEWFSILEAYDARQAGRTRQVIKQAESPDVCSICGDTPAMDYKLVHPVPAARSVPTLRLCDDCRLIRELSGESFVPR